MKQELSGAERAWQDPEGLIVPLFRRLDRPPPAITHRSGSSSVESLSSSGGPWRTRVILRAEPELLIHVWQTGPDHTRFLRIQQRRSAGGTLQSLVDGKPKGATIKALRKHGVSVAAIQRGLEVEGALPSNLVSFLSEALA